MKDISSTILTHCTGETLTLATCWRVTRRDGIVRGYTDHDRTLTVGGVLYEASTGFLPSSIHSSDQLNVDHLEVEGMITAGGMTEEDIVAGRYDQAEIYVFAVNYLNPDAGIIPLRYGWVGEIRWDGAMFVAEMRGLTQKLAQHIGAQYSPVCRAFLGDAQCKVSMTSRTVTGSITGVQSHQSFYDSTRSEPAQRFTHGVLTFTSGANQGIASEVLHYQSPEIQLALPLPFAPTIGDSYSMTEGCDRSFTTCTARFNNALNFRGEPHIPGMDRMLETATTRQRS
jgi:uncharacterized phage protein (TIGR02218 family)